MWTSARQLPRRLWKVEGASHAENGRSVLNGFRGLMRALKSPFGSQSEQDLHFDSDSFWTLLRTFIISHHHMPPTHVESVVTIISVTDGIMWTCAAYTPLRVLSPYVLPYMPFCPSLPRY